MSSYTESDSRIGRWQGGTLSLSQAKPAPKQLGLKARAMQAGLKFSGCPTQPAPILESRAVYTYQQLPQKYFIGFELRTNNQVCSSAMPAHKEKFFRENISAKIPNKINRNILALYTDYEGDYTGDYSWILGCEVSSLDEVPEGLVGKLIPPFKYAVFTTKGAFPQGLIAAWQEIWKADLSRSYTNDFEVYREDFDPQKNPEVKVYIAVK